MALQRLKEAAEKAKCELSTTPETDVNLPVRDGRLDGSQAPQREADAGGVRARSATSCSTASRTRAWRRLKLTRRCPPSDIDEVILVGGSTRIPKVQEIAKSIFGKEPAQAA